MNQAKHILCSLSVAAATLLDASGQSFNSGSTGAYGPMNITANTTLDLPPDGIFHCTTINVAAGTTLKFNRNALNTPVYLLATGDVSINGTIDVSGESGTSALGGKGGAGGFDGGVPAVGGLPPGAGLGPGAGRGGLGLTAQSSPGYGAYGAAIINQSTNNGAVYGSPLLVPLVGGSGGGGSTTGGGGGGGAVLVASSTRVAFTGVIRARGGSGTGSGSGGAIRVVTPVITGNGAFDIAGGNGTQNYGRIRIDAVDRSGAQFNPTGPWTFGGFMQVFPTPLPRLDILNAAGTAIPEGNAAAVVVHLPFGSSPEQSFTIQARNFGASVPINLVLTPTSGQPVTVPATIDNSSANPAAVTISASVPVNEIVTVNAWTR